MSLCPRSHLFGDPLLDDFRNFVDYCLMGTLGVHATPNQFEAADIIWRGGIRDPKRYDEVPKKRMFQGFRGFSKSTLTGFYACWEVRRAYEYTNGRPNCNIMICSGTGDLAANIASFIRDTIECLPILKILVPKDRDEKWAGSRMNVEGRVPAVTPTIFARALMGRLTGDRADLIIFDDVEIPSNSESVTQRGRVLMRCQEFIDVLTPGGEMLGLCTPQLEDTLYVKLEAWGFQVWKLPITYPDMRWMGLHGSNLVERIARRLEENPALEGTPTEPERFDEETIDGRRRVSRARFALQNMLDTSLADEDRHPLKCRDLIVMDLDPSVAPERPLWTNDPDRCLQHLPCVGLHKDAYYAPRLVAARDVRMSSYDHRRMSVDPSGRGKDETGYAVGAAIGGMIYLLECRGLVGGSGPAVLDKLIARACHFKVQVCTVEANANAAFSALLISHMQSWMANPEHALELDGWPGMSVEEVWHSQMKETRIIDTIEPITSNHRLVVSTKVIEDDRPGVSGSEAAETYRLFHQLTRIEHVKGALVHDDRLDALAQLLDGLIERMKLIVDHAATHRDAQEEARIWHDFWARRQASKFGQPRTGRSNIAFRNKRRSTMGPRGTIARSTKPPSIFRS